MIKKILLIFFFLYFNNNFSQHNPVTPNTIVSVLTVGLADDVASLYGHTAIRIKEPAAGLDIVFNYGMFDFATKNFIVKFAKGDLQYYAAAYPYTDFEYSYKLDNRSIYEQILDLSFSEKKLLFEKLRTSLKPESCFYTYKFIDRNCTTKVIDILNEVLTGNPIAKKNTSKKTYRDVLYPYAKNHFFEQLGINIIFGTKVDQQANHLFLPLDLYDNLKEITYKDKLLVTENKVLYEANRVGYKSYINSIYLLFLFLGFVLILNKKILNAFYFSLLGLIGLLFFIMEFYSFHHELYNNYNLFLLNPLFLTLAFFLIKNNTKCINLLCYISIISIVIYIFLLIGRIHFWIVFPIVVTTLFQLIRILLINRKLLSLTTKK